MRRLLDGSFCRSGGHDRFSVRCRHFGILNAPATRIVIGTVQTTGIGDCTPGNGKPAGRGLPARRLDAGSAVLGFRISRTSAPRFGGLRRIYVWRKAQTRPFEVLKHESCEDFIALETPVATSQGEYQKVLIGCFGSNSRPVCVVAAWAIQQHVKAADFSTRPISPGGLSILRTMPSGWLRVSSRWNFSRRR